jgi:uncharacterized protein (UPF0276 family)
MPADDNLAGRVGLGLRAPHFQDLREQGPGPGVGWFEVHAENYIGGGAQARLLERLRRDHPISLHGVTMGLLSPDPLDARHLEAWSRLIERFDPVLVSEHLCWTRLDGVHFHDLLPAPATPQMLAFAIERVGQVQDRLRRRFAIENITRYVEFNASTIPEGDFLAELAQRTGCALLVDLENLHLNEVNLGVPALDVLRALPADAVAELHIAGHSAAAGGLLVDDHGGAVPEAVWALLRVARQLWGPVPTLLERDNHIPPLFELLAECQRAQAVLGPVGAGAHAEAA